MSIISQFALHMGKIELVFIRKSFKQQMLLRGQAGVISAD